MVRSKIVKPVPCAHIADYYDFQWLTNPQIGSNLLRQGYRQWSEGRIQNSHHNNLYGKERRPYNPSPKQVLVRDYNWRMGNLRRLQYSTRSLDSDVECMIHNAVAIQMQRETVRHQIDLFMERMRQWHQLNNRL